MAKIPPPEKRLCRKHGKPICPSLWAKKYRTVGCAGCLRERARSPESRKRRNERWHKEFISCIRHPERRCNRSVYVSMASRKCASCHSHYVDGSPKPSYSRRRNKSSPLKQAMDRRSGYKKFRKRRNNNPFGTKLTGLQIFENVTGLNLGGHPARINR